ncbi:hypothetical protein VTN00DRAFT_1212 [Thermoascus crustaceus]|uniref:uncharacterized protein n=1 Tax=Thermoascus crustaceus TaxID=5088 RepID=UPI003742E522
MAKKVSTSDGDWIARELGRLAETARQSLTGTEWPPGIGGSPGGEGKVRMGRVVDGAMRVQVMQDAGPEAQETRGEQVQSSDESRAASWGGGNAKEMMCSVQKDGSGYPAGTPTSDLTAAVSLVSTGATACAVEWASTAGSPSNVQNSSARARARHPTGPPILSPV